MTSVHWHSAGLAEVPDDSGWMSDVERDRFARMRYPKRRLEAMLGRWTAKNCVAGVLGLGLGHESLADVLVKNAPDGAPEVFVSGEHLPWVIAMTDRADWGAAALRQGSERIGLDLEVVEPRSELFVADYFTPYEQRVALEGDTPVLANLIWSAKESALKVLRTGLRRDTRTVEVHLRRSGVDSGNILPESTPERDGSGADGSWAALDVTVDGGTVGGGTVLPGWWTRFGEFVFTFVSEVDEPPPTSLQVPPPLASAVPTHTWMPKD